MAEDDEVTFEIDFSRFLDAFDTYDRVAIAVTVFGLLIRLFLSPHCFWIDESREMAIARNLMQGDGYTLYGDYYVQHPYVFYTLIGVSSLVLGMTDFAGIAVSIVAGAASIFAVYLLGREVYNEKVGLMSAILLNFHPLHLFYSVRVINDITMIMFTVLAMYFFVKFNRRQDWTALYLCSAFTALAILTKVIALVLIPVFAVYLLVKKRLTWLKDPRYWKAVAPFAVLFGLYVAINLYSLGTPFPLDYYLARFQPGGVDPQPWTYYITNFTSLVRLPIALLFGWGLLCVFLRKFKNSRFLLFWIALFFTVISLQSDKVDRYIMPVIPQMVVIASLGLYKVVKDFKEKGYVIYGLVACILLISSYTMYSEAAAMVSGQSTGFCGFRETGQWLQQVTTPDVNLMVGSDNQIAWYADRENIHHFPRTVEEFYSYIYSNRIDLLVVDRWERTQPSYVFTYDNQGRASFWYPSFLNDSAFPVVNAISHNDQPVSFIYFVNYTLIQQRTAGA